MPLTESVTKVRISGILVGWPAKSQIHRFEDLSGP